MKLFISVFLLFLLTPFFLIAQSTVHVPDDYATIQDAINGSESGDTVIVSPGTYLENINFKGKDIYLTSNYYFDRDTSFISTTIIDGSDHTDPDTGSVVQFRNEETRNAVLQGFTITGGTGTRNYNTSENLYFRTGGGILIDHASPTIRHNIITGNSSTDETGSSGAGGGGIRAGQSQADISYNIITYNKGGYAGGVMLAFSEGLLFKNNLVAYNEAGTTANGGGGVYIDWENVPIINSTIVHNTSGGDGGGMIITGAKKSIIVNSIIYNNTANPNSTSQQIFLRFDGTSDISYSNIQGGAAGIGNLDIEPLFSDTLHFALTEESQCIDAGNPLPVYYDAEDPNSLGNALSPAQGGLRNDLGWQGGNANSRVSASNIILNPALNKLYLAPGTDTLKIAAEINATNVKLDAYIFSNDLGLVDTVSMVENGVTDDNVGFFGKWFVPVGEKVYTIHLSAYLPDSGYYIALENAATFSTKGPVKLDYYTYSSDDTLANPGDKLPFKMTLRNFGQTETIASVSVNFKRIEGQFITAQTRIGLPEQAFGDIDAGEAIERSLVLRIDDDAPVGTKQSLEMVVSSAGKTFWLDTLTKEIKEITTGIISINEEKPEEIQLLKNYPNPFNPYTTIVFNIREPGMTELIIYDLLGRNVNTLVSSYYAPGTYRVQWGGRDSNGNSVGQGFIFTH